MKLNSKRYRTSVEQLTKKAYPLQEAFEILLKLPSVKFDETVELSLHLGVDTKQTGQTTRGTVQLPHGNGKTMRIIAFTQDAKRALDLGACEAGLADLIAKVKGGWLEFDVAVASIEAMKEVKTLAPILGPKGLMPNPKAGTVAKEIDECIEALKKGRVEFKMDKGANIQLGIGKRSFGAEKLLINAESVLNAIHQARPINFHGRFVVRAFVASTMSPSISLDEAVFAKL